MDLRSLRYLVHTADEGSIHGGARAAMVSQPAVSKCLKQLEREVGAVLLERSPDGVVLTPAGATLVARARAILDDLERARLDAAAPVPGTRFAVGLVAGHVAAGELTGIIMNRFRKRHPALDLRVRELDFAEQFTSVRDGAVDVAVVRSPYDAPGLAMAPLFSEPIVLAASRDHPLARVSCTTVDAAMQERTLDIVSTPSPWREFWSLGAARGATGHTHASRAVNILEVSLDLTRHRAVNPMAMGAWRLGGPFGPDLRAVRLVDAARSVAGVGYRVGDGRPEVASFVQTARDVAEEMIDLVPHGRSEVGAQA